MTSKPHPAVSEQLVGTAIVLGDDEILYDYGNPNVYLAYTRPREILAESGIPIVDSELEHRYRGLLAKKTPEMTPTVLSDIRCIFADSDLLFVDTEFQKNHRDVLFKKFSVKAFSRDVLIKNTDKQGKGE